jgi:hypothetical protein
LDKFGLQGPEPRGSGARREVSRRHPEMVTGDRSADA